MSLGPATKSKLSGEGGGGSDAGGGGCCLGGPGKRPIKCQRCGSGRVHLFAKAASMRLLPGYLRPLSPAADRRRGNISRAPATTSAASGRSGSGGGGGGSGSAAGRLPSAPFGNSGSSGSGVKSMSRQGCALTPTFPRSPRADHNKISGWSDNGRPTGTRSRPQRGCGGGGGGSGTTTGGHDRRIVVDLRGGIDPAHAGRRVSPGHH
eukprot:g3532.t1